MFFPLVVVLFALMGFVSPHPLDRLDFGDKLSALVDILHNKCFERTGVTQEAVDEVKNGNFIDDLKVKKYITCLLEETIIDKHGELNVNRMMELCPPKVKDKFPKVFETCFKKNAGIQDLDNRNYNTIKCISDTDDELLIMF